MLQGGDGTSQCALHFSEHELLTRESCPTGGSEIILLVESSDCKDQKEST